MREEGGEVVAVIGLATALHRATIAIDATRTLTDQGGTIKATVGNNKLSLKRIVIDIGGPPPPSSIENEPERER